MAVVLAALLLKTPSGRRKRLEAYLGTLREHEDDLRAVTVVLPLPGGVVDGGLPHDNLDIQHIGHRWVLHGGHDGVPPVFPMAKFRIPQPHGTISLAGFLNFSMLSLNILNRRAGKRMLQ